MRDFGSRRAERIWEVGNFVFLIIMKTKYEAICYAT